MKKRKPDDRKTKSKKGLSLVEIVVSVAILAIIAVPILNLFAESTQNTSTSANITAAAFLCQTEMERLIQMDYLSLLEESRNGYDSATNELTLHYASDGSNPQIGYTVRILPGGVHQDLLSTGETSAYVHLLFYKPSSGTAVKLSALFPDGRSQLFSPVGSQVTVAPVSSSSLYNCGMTTGSPSVTSYFSVDAGARLILLANLSQMTSGSLSSSLVLSSFTSQAMPKVVYYANDAAMIANVPIVPAPAMGATQKYIGGDSYGSMLVTVYINAYYVQGTTKRKLAGIHDTLSPKILIPAT